MGSQQQEARIMGGKNVLEKIKDLAQRQQANCHTDGPGYNDKSGDNDHTKDGW